MPTTPATGQAPFEEGSAPSFILRGRDTTLVGYGQAATLRSGSAATIADRLDAFFRNAEPGVVLAGAMPFDPTADDDLRQPRRIANELPQGRPSAAPGPWSLRHEPDAAGYADAVRRALDIMAKEVAQDVVPEERLSKVVLSRRLVASASETIDAIALLRRLAVDTSVTAFLVPLPDARHGPRMLAGATPELLLSKRHDRVTSHPLAGSARRHRDPGRDVAAGQALLRSEKDQREHAVAVEFVLDMLAPRCRALRRPNGVELQSTASMWHLGTFIEGRLKDPDTSAAVLASILHPTPAVCGLPRERAAELIGKLEPYNRAFYGGTVGWCDRRGDGAWYVAIRCAEVTAKTAVLYAGAGIVPGSEPWKEVDETAAKYGAMLAALDIGMIEERVCRSSDVASGGTVMPVLGLCPG